MRLPLVISLLMAGCATSLDPLPKQPDAPTSESIVAAVGKQWDTADAKVSAAISIAKENADKPEVVRSETAVALSFLPSPMLANLPSPGHAPLRPIKRTTPRPKPSARNSSPR